MIKLTVVGASVLLWSTVQADEPSKSDRIDAVIRAEQSLEILAKREQFHQGERDFNQRIPKEVAATIPQLSPDQLGKLAMVCLTIAWPQDAKDVGYDETFYCGFWECLQRLFARKDRESKDALIFIRDHARLDGGEKLSFDEFWDKMQKVSK